MELQVREALCTINRLHLFIFILTIIFVFIQDHFEQQYIGIRNPEMLINPQVFFLYHIVIMNKFNLRCLLIAYFFKLPWPNFFSQ